MKRAAVLMTTAARQADPAVEICEDSCTEPLHCSRNTLICLLMGKFDLNKITETRYNCVCTLKRIRAMN